MFADARRGSALIEALIALVVLALAGSALIALLGQATHSVANLRRTESDVDSAAARLDALILLDRHALLERIGPHTVTGFSIDVGQSSATLFSVSVARAPGAPQLLRTLLYRPESPDDTQ